MFVAFNFPGRHVVHHVPEVPRLAVVPIPVDVLDAPQRALVLHAGETGVPMVRRHERLEASQSLCKPRSWSLRE